MAYIDVDKFAEEICKFPAIDEHSANAVISLLRSQTTADVAEVVRCGDCTYAHYNKDAKAFSCKRRDWYSEFVRPTDFCNHGVKMDGERKGAE